MGDLIRMCSTGVPRAYPKTSSHMEKNRGEGNREEIEGK
jgi:hypothetical protein